MDKRREKIGGKPNRDRAKLTKALLLGAALGTLPLQLVGCVQAPTDPKDPAVSSQALGQTGAEDIGTRKAMFLQAASANDPKAVEKFLDSYPNDPSIPDLLTALPPRVLSRITPAAFAKVPPPLLVQIPRPVALQLRLPPLQRITPQPQSPFNPVFQATY